MILYDIHGKPIHTPIQEEISFKGIANSFNNIFKTKPTNASVLPHTLCKSSEPAITSKPEQINEDDMNDIKDMFNRYADEWNLTYSDIDEYDTYTMTMVTVNQGGIRGGRYQAGINPEMTILMKIWFDNRAYTDEQRIE